MTIFDEGLLDKTKPITIIIPDEYVGMRIDVVLSQLMPSISRTKLANWLKNGYIIINGRTLKPKERVYGSEEITIIPVTPDEDLSLTPENIPLNIIYQDEQVIVINKPARLTVHPGNGNWHHTLLNGLLFKFPELSQIPRAGIIHRLDKDTSGLMVIAKSMSARTALIQDLQARKIDRIYRAIVEGHPAQEGIISKNIGRDPHNRTKMLVRAIGGKEAITHYKVLKYFEKFSYVECKLETGRTHQIRVHMKFLGHPIAGDQVYGQRKINYSSQIVDAIKALNRQALHAVKLSFHHPESKEIMEFKTSLAEDIKHLLQQLFLDEKQSSL